MEYGLLVLWLFVYLAVLLAGLPLAAVLFPRLADRGVGVALPLAAAVLWLVGYWVGHLSLFLAPWLGVALLLVVAAAAASRSRPDIDPRVVAETAAVFALAFLFLIAVRAVDPAVHPLGGEKFLDFGLLRSLLRAETLPPEDMWFAGEPVSYYYGGHLLASLFTRLTGTAPRFAYNLALAGFYAMLVTAAYGLAGSVAAHRGSPRRLGAALGAFFVGVASNLSTPAELAVWLLPDGVAATATDLLSIERSGLSRSPADFSYWDASRVIEGTVNEFPLFAWLNGDLHAHMMSTPFLLLVAALCFSYYLTPPSAVRRRRLLVLALSPLAGLLAVVNTWSFPTVAGLAVLTLSLAPSDPRSLLPRTVATRLRHPDPPRDEASRLLTAAAVGALVVVLGLAWSGPFWFGTASGRAIGLFPDRSRFGPLLLVHGGFLFVFVPYLLRHSRSRLRFGGRVGVPLLLVALLGVVTAPAVTLFAPLIGLSWALLRVTGGPPATDRATRTSTSPDGGREAAGTADRSPPDGPGFELVLVAAGAGLALLVEFAFIEEQAGPGRLNTVFKTYMQVWVLWAVAAGTALSHLCWRHRPGLALAGGRWRPAFRAFAVVLVASTSLYGAFALAEHFADDSAPARTGDPTLNATAFVATEHPEEAPAIRWLDDREGRPTIVSAPGGYYWEPDRGEGASAAASLTGVPTVVGWHHEIGYRGRAAYDRRAEHVETIYVGPAADQARLLAEYGVEYVYVGPAERARYERITVGDLPGVTVAQSWEEVTVYRVDRDALPEDGG